MNQSIICPAGLGETDISRCLDRMPETAQCLLCPIPVALIASGGTDNLNKHIAARLRHQISCPWTPPPAWVSEAVRYARQVSALVDIPCTAYHFYAAMRRAGAPKLSPRRLPRVIRAAGFEVISGGGLERVVRGEAA